MKRMRRVFLKTSSLALGLISFFGIAGRVFAIPRTSNPVWNGIERDCVVTCPACKQKVQETMSSESVKRVYHCPTCLTWLSPKKGDHCIYDSYGSVKCPAIQLKMRGAQNLSI
jgi:hypothetical protein